MEFTKLNENDDENFILFFYFFNKFKLDRIRIFIVKLDQQFQYRVLFNISIISKPNGSSHRMIIWKTHYRHQEKSTSLP